MDPAAVQLNAGMLGYSLEGGTVQHNSERCQINAPSVL